MKELQSHGDFFIIPERFAKSSTSDKCRALLREGDILITKDRAWYHSGEKVEVLREDDLEKIEGLRKQLNQMASGTGTGRIFILTELSSEQRGLLEIFFTVFDDLRMNIASHSELKRAPGLIYKLLAGKIGLNWSSSESLSGKILGKIEDLVSQNPRLLCLIEFIDVGEGEPVKVGRITDRNMIKLLKSCTEELVNLLEHSVQYDQKVYYKAIQFLLTKLFINYLTESGRYSSEIKALLPYFSDAIIFEYKTIENPKAKAEGNGLISSISEILRGIQTIIQRGYKHLLPNHQDPLLPKYFQGVQDIYETYYQELSTIEETLSNYRAIKEKCRSDDHRLAVSEEDLDAEVVKTLLLLDIMVFPHLYLTTQLIPLLSGYPTYVITTYYNITYSIRDLKKHLYILRENFVKCPGIYRDKFKEFVKKELKSSKIKEQALKIANIRVKFHSEDRSSLDACSKELFPNTQRKTTKNIKAYALWGNDLILETSIGRARHLMNIAHGILPSSLISLEVHNFRRVTSSIVELVVNFLMRSSELLTSPEFTNLLVSSLDRRFVYGKLSSQVDDEIRKKLDELLNELTTNLEDLYGYLEKIKKKHTELVKLISNLMSDAQEIKRVMDDELGLIWDFLPELLLLGISSHPQ